MRPSRLVKWDPTFSASATGTWASTSFAEKLSFDETGAGNEFGLEPTPFRQTNADTVRSLIESRRVPARSGPRVKERT